MNKHPANWTKGTIVHLNTNLGNRNKVSIVICSGNHTDGFYWVDLRWNDRQPLGPWNPNLHDMEYEGWEVDGALDNPMLNLMRKYGSQP